MMSLSIVIPVLNQHERFFYVLDTICRTTRIDNLEILLIDNASDPPLSDDEDILNRIIQGYRNHHTISIIRNEKNVGMFESLLQAARYSTRTILVYTHYDVLFWTPGWDQIIHDAFVKDEKLGIAGLVGAPGLQGNGGRVGTVSRLVGKVWGGNGTNEVWRVHGGWTPDGGLPVAVLDGCGMFFRRDTVEPLLDMNYRGLHHFYDCETSAAWLAAGYHIRVLPIAADHGGGTAGGEQLYGDSARERAKELGITELPEGLINWDQVQYNLNGDRFQNKWGPFMPVFVDTGYNTNWRNKPW